MNPVPVHAQTRSDAITELKRRLQEQLANDNRAPRMEKTAEKEEPQSEATTEWQEENFQEGADQRKTAIVGSWLGTTGEGNKILNSFTADGVPLVPCKARSAQFPNSASSQLDIAFGSISAGGASRLLRLALSTTSIRANYWGSSKLSRCIRSIRQAMK